MICVVSTVRVRPDKAETFERLVSELTARIKANEPGALLYQMLRSQTEPHAYTCVEFYRDQAALDEHARAGYFQAAMAALADCMAGEPQTEFFAPVE